MDHYTHEDYLKDFEFDYLGFHQVQDEPVSALPPEQISDDKIESEIAGFGEDTLPDKLKTVIRHPGRRE